MAKIGPKLRPQPLSWSASVHLRRVHRLQHISMSLDKLPPSEASTSDSDRDSGGDSNKDVSGTGPSGTTAALDLDRSADALALRIRVELGAEQSGRIQSLGSDRTVESVAAPEGPRGNAFVRRQLHRGLRLGNFRGVVADDQIWG
jgi:hypothetical protein